MGEDFCTFDYLSHICDAVNRNISLLTKLKERNTAAQVLLFQFCYYFYIIKKVASKESKMRFQILVLDCIEKPGHKLIVANTHLYFHPKADHIRLLQAGICLGYLNDLLNRMKKEV